MLRLLAKFARGVGFISRLEWKMGPTLKNTTRGVHFSPVRQGDVVLLPRRVEQYSSHTVLIKKGLGSPTRVVEQETSPFEQVQLCILRTLYCPYRMYPVV